jgi:hypothetical protein
LAGAPGGGRVCCGRFVVAGDGSMHLNQNIFLKKYLGMTGPFRLPS